MSACVLSNLLNKLRKKIRNDTLLSILLVFPNEFNKFNNTGAWVIDSIYHMTLKLHLISDFLISDFGIKTSIFHH